MKRTSTRRSSASRRRENRKWRRRLFLRRRNGLRRRFEHVLLAEPRLLALPGDLDLDLAPALRLVRILRVIPQRLAEGVLVDDGDASYLFHDDVQAVLRFPDVLVPLLRICLVCDFAQPEQP